MTRVTGRLLLGFLALTAAYVLTGRLGLLLAVPPGYATAIFPPAGLAVSAMLIAGAATLPATFLGSLLLNLWVAYSLAHRLTGVGVATALVIAAASVLQAAIGVLGCAARFATPRPLCRLADGAVLCAVCRDIRSRQQLGGRSGAARIPPPLATPGGYVAGEPGGRRRFPRAARRVLCRTPPGNYTGRLQGACS